MRRSTAAAVGTISGAALIVAVRLSVPGAASTAAPPGFDLSAVNGDPAGSSTDEGGPAGAGAAASASPTPGPSRDRRSGDDADDADDARDANGTDDTDASGRSGDEEEKNSDEEKNRDDDGKSDAGERGEGERGDRNGGSGRSKSPASGLNDGRFVGRPVSHQFGTVQVAVTISDGRITKTSVRAPTEGVSGLINSRAVPTLNQEVLVAQSARIDAVSGATLTSRSYATSLQAALDAARA